MARMKGDIPVALVVAALGVFFLIQARMIEGSQDALVGPRLVPMVISVLIVALGILQLVLSLIARNGRSRDADGSVIGEGEPPLAVLSPAIMFRMAAIIALGVAYIWLFSATGYLISTAVILAALLVVFGNHALGRVALLAVGGTAAYYAIFIKLLGIHDPGGWLIDVGSLGL